MDSKLVIKHIIAKKLCSVLHQLPFVQSTKCIRNTIYTQYNHYYNKLIIDDEIIKNISIDNIPISIQSGYSNDYPLVTPIEYNNISPFSRYILCHMLTARLTKWINPIYDRSILIRAINNISIPNISDTNLKYWYHHKRPWQSVQWYYYPEWSDYKRYNSSISQVWKPGKLAVVIKKLMDNNRDISRFSVINCMCGIYRTGLRYVPPEFWIQIMNLCGNTIKTVLDVDSRWGMKFIAFKNINYHTDHSGTISLGSDCKYRIYPDHGNNYDMIILSNFDPIPKIQALQLLDKYYNRANFVAIIVYAQDIKDIYTRYHAKLHIPIYGWNKGYQSKYTNHPVLLLYDRTPIKYTRWSR